MGHGVFSRLETQKAAGRTILSGQGGPSLVQAKQGLVVQVVTGPHPGPHPGLRLTAWRAGQGLWAPDRDAVSGAGRGRNRGLTDPAVLADGIGHV